MKPSTPSYESSSFEAIPPRPVAARLFFRPFPALFTVLLAFEGERSALGAGRSPGDAAGSVVPAQFSWSDFDGDGRLDLAAVRDDGTLQLLAGTRDGRFEDVTERVGLGEVGATAIALWADYDADGRLDLFVGARAGASRLFRNEGGAFTDMSAASGLATEGAVRSAQWLDHDGDGRLDLFVVTAEKSELYRGLEGGFLERSELPALAGAGVVSIPGGPMVVGGPPASIPSGAPRNDDVRGGASIDGSLVVPGSSRAAIVVGPGSGPSGTPSSGLILNCLPAVRDQANPGACLQASSTPTLGRLYPISANLFVAVGGNVGIGTTTPAAKLDVAGTARVTDTLTLAPGGDTALDVSTGSIYMGGALFIHTKGGGVRNTAIGREALASVTTGTRNTASGYRALFYNTDGSDNTASGNRALFSNTTGHGNTASGTYALFSNTTGYGNTASGRRALYSNTTGHGNTASGFQALFNNTTGLHNTASGSWALHYNTTGSSNTASGLRALFFNTTGARNAASGQQALSSNTTGSYSTASGFQALFNNTTGRHNTASGYRALYSNTTGERNIALGHRAGVNLATGNDNILIGHQGVAAESATIRMGILGTHTRAFIAGIRGVTTGVADGIPVLIDSNGQLGTVSSSRRFKEEIRDMGELTERLLELRPVTFRYKPEVQAGERPVEYGLIAEEVAEVFPELVVYDEEGLPFTVKYHLLSAMLLNELKEQARAVEEREATHSRELEELRARSEAQTRETDEVRSELARLRDLETRMAALESRAHEMTTPTAAERENYYSVSSKTRRRKSCSELGDTLREPAGLDSRRRERRRLLRRDRRGVPLR